MKNIARFFLFTEQNGTSECAVQFRPERGGFGIELEIVCITRMNVLGSKLVVS